MNTSTDPLNGCGRPEATGFEQKGEKNLKRKIARGLLRFLLILSVLFCLSACQEEGPTGEGERVVYCSFFPVYDLTREIVGEEDVDVRSFMPVGVDPHLWEPTVKDMKKLAEADLLVVNGAYMEAWLDQVKSGLPNLQVLDLSEDIDLITYKGAADPGDFRYVGKMSLKKGEEYAIQFGHTHEDSILFAFLQEPGELSDDDIVVQGKEIMSGDRQFIRQEEHFPVQDRQVYEIEMGHISGIVYFTVPEDGDYLVYSDRITEPLLPYEFWQGDEAVSVQELMEGSSASLDRISYDPHSWLSLANAKKYCNSINRTLADLYPDMEDAFQKNKVDYVTSLTRLEHEYKQKFKEIEDRNFLVTHYAYAYLARDFDLKQYPLQSLTGMEDLSLHTIRKALKFSQDNAINTIFYEEGASNKDALSIADEMGGEAVALTSMEYISSPDARYIEIMEENLQKLYESMKGGDKDE